MAEKRELAQAIEGSDGTPGSGFCRKVAMVFVLPRTI